MSEQKNQSPFKRVIGAVAITGGVIAAIATFSGNLTTILKNGKEVLLNVAQGPKSIPFEIKTYEPRFIVLGTMSGDAALEKPFIKIRVTNSTLRTQKQASVSVSYVRLGLAYVQRAPATWDVAAWSEKKKIEQIIENFSTVSIPAFDAVIPIDGIKNLADHWLVLEIGLSDGATTYMHSDRLVFSR